MAWRLYDYVGVLKGSGRTTSSLSLPLYWVAWIGVAGLIIYAVGVIVTGFDRTRVEGEPDSSGEPKMPIDLPTSDDER